MTISTLRRNLEDGVYGPMVAPNYQDYPSEPLFPRIKDLLDRKTDEEIMRLLPKYRARMARYQRTSVTSYRQAVERWKANIEAGHQRLREDLEAVAGRPEVADVFLKACGFDRLAEVEGATEERKVLQDIVARACSILIVLERMRRTHGWVEDTQI